MFFIRRRGYGKERAISESTIKKEWSALAASSAFTYIMYNFTPELFLAADREDVVSSADKLLRKPGLVPTFINLSSLQSQPATSWW
jgi:hypothetical protein